MHQALFKTPYVIMLFNPQNSPVEETLIVPSLQMRRLRQREYNFLSLFFFLWITNIECLL